LDRVGVDLGQRSRAMHITLWIVQILLAALFLMTGAMKAFMPLDEVAKTMRWVPALPAGLVRFIGLAELAGALGLILPSATKIYPKLTPLAAVGLGVVVLLGAILHFTRGEGALTPLNFILAAMAAFVAWGRTQKAPISAGTA
jgi:putative oxidoreductase